MRVCICMTMLIFDAMHTNYNYRPVFHTGQVGKYMFRVSPDRKIVNYEQKCYDWFAGEMERERLLQFYWSWTLVCPCDRRLASMDKRWRMYLKQLNEVRSDRDCFYERMPMAQSTQVVTAISSHNTTLMIISTY